MAEVESVMIGKKKKTTQQARQTFPWSLLTLSFPEEANKEFLFTTTILTSKPFNSQTKLLILLTVNHTILMMLAQRIEYWIN